MDPSPYSNPVKHTRIRLLQSLQTQPSKPRPCTAVVCALTLTLKRIPSLNNLARSIKFPSFQRSSEASFSRITGCRALSQTQVHKIMGKRQNRFRCPTFAVYCKRIYQQEWIWDYGSVIYANHSGVIRVSWSDTNGSQVAAMPLRRSKLDKNAAAWAA